MSISDDELYEVIQQVHELTERNAPESAGAAWAALFDELIGVARMHPTMNAKEVVIRALEVSDMPASELLLLRPKFVSQANEIVWTKGPSHA